jgi:hypothetical protein
MFGKGNDRYLTDVEKARKKRSEKSNRYSSEKELLWQVAQEDWKSINSGGKNKSDRKK